MLIEPIIVNWPLPTRQITDQIASRLQSTSPAGKNSLSFRKRAEKFKASTPVDESRDDHGVFQ